MRGWQPIETAPRNGTRVLVWGPRFVVQIDSHEPPCGHGCDSEGCAESPFMAGVTHWMPIPAPPQEEPRG
jgi:hypothetical protein